ncbi:COBRA-like protein [Actinidia chinensis var. chinensis]|uniref:COBRA-like protein n=1 Tax=Actinidia chinensis var. chinensis TaxID=1590841 RepID=A0A2R6R1E0_ACTCC|nr:COBRA-like protein [Actinidia chinensis var. chinensis]
MNTLARTTTLKFSRGSDSYELLDQTRQKSEKQRIMTTTFSLRGERAKKRQIFLSTYKLKMASMSVNQSGKSKSRMIKMVASKVKSVAASTAASFVRFNSLGSCKCRSAVCASSPIRIQKRF